MVQPGRKFQQSFKAVTQIDRLLQDDSHLTLRQFRDAVAKFDEENSQENGEAADFYAKSAIRAFLGYVDGIGFALRRVVLSSADEVSLEIPPKKLAELMERRYDAKAGSILDEEKRLSTEPGIKIAVAWFAKLFGSDFVLKTDGEEWRGFKRLIKVRNDFTHPKTLEHLSARLAFPAIHPTIVWFLGQMRDMFADISARLGNPQPPEDEVPLEYPYREIDHPFSSIFSDQDLSDIQSVAARTMQYVILMLEKSSADVSRASRLIKASSLPLFSHEYQCAVRTAVRTLFSDVEARTAAAMFFIEASEKRGEIVISEDEKVALSAGTIEEQLVGTLTIFSREFGNNYVPTTAGEAWKNFRGARFFRDRLTHPKDLQSLQVDAKKVTMFLSAAQYFASTFGALLLDPDKVAAKAGYLDKIIVEQRAQENDAPTEDDGED